MKSKIDHFLLGLLWLLAMTLGASFLFNTKFGFNIFDVKHWAYLGQLQASKAPISAWFYIYMLIVVIVMIFGLYMIVRPRLRKISLNKQTVVPTPIAAPVPQVAEPIAETPVAAADLARPPRLNVPVGGPVMPAPKPTNIEAPVAATAPIISSDEFKEIEDIFKNNGYTVKNPPQIGSLKPALLAIGPDEALWIGAVGIEPAALAQSVNMLRKIFSDTLEDIPIHINAFVLNPQSGDIPDIIYFDSMDALRERMELNKAAANADPENFDAYSEYIDTVIGYVNKL